MRNPTDKIAQLTSYFTPVVEPWLERKIAEWIHHEGPIQRSIAP